MPTTFNARAVEALGARRARLTTLRRRSAAAALATFALALGAVATEPASSTTSAGTQAAVTTPSVDTTSSAADAQAATPSQTQLPAVSTQAS